VSRVTAELEIVVCQGPTCGLMDNHALIAWCDALAEAGLPVTHEVSGCTGNCLEAPVAMCNERIITEASPERLTAALIEEDLL